MNYYYVVLLEIQHQVLKIITNTQFIYYSFQFTSPVSGMRSS